MPMASAQQQMDPTMMGGAQQQGPKTLDLPQQNPIPSVQPKDPEDIKKD